MYYIIYKITNKINGKYYIGSHKTPDLNDNYMGSGKYLNHAKIKYGIENFQKEILFVYDTAEEMYDKEREIVNESFLSIENTYNLKLGGDGGFDYINSNKDLRINKNKKARKSTNSKHNDKLSEWGKKGGLANFSKNGVNSSFINAGKTSFLGKQHSEKTKRKIGEPNSKSQNGEKNSQFGTIWITNDICNMKIKKDSTIPCGWKKGRNMKAGLV